MAPAEGSGEGKLVGYSVGGSVGGTSVESEVSVAAGSKDTWADVAVGKGVTGIRAPLASTVAVLPVSNT